MLNLRKNSGLEAIPIYQFKKCFKNAVNAKPDEKLFLQRFAGQDYRLIMYKSPDIDNLMYIIGFDFDHTAYDHGS